jgi:hypothetical protein
MEKKPNNGLARKALSISILLNLTLVFCAMLGGPNGIGKALIWLSELIAAPPSPVIHLVVTPSQQMAQSLFLTAADSLAISLLFYYLAAWVILHLGYGIARILRNRKPPENIRIF